MTKSSGGILAYNLREGFRSEHLAHYALSAFGPSTPILREDDHGIDFLCHLAQRTGNMATIGSAYGVQVKSGDPVVKYEGKQVFQWLNSLQIPLFVATVDKSMSHIRIYSTWNVHRFLLIFENDPNRKRPDTIVLRGSDCNEPLPAPNPETGDVPIGKPILDFCLQELGDKGVREHHLHVLREWVEMDRQNYTFRLAGITMACGYIKWVTNKHLQESVRTWYRPYYYSAATADKARKLLCQLATVISLYQGQALKSKNPDQVQHAERELIALSNYVNRFCSHHFDKFQKGIFPPIKSGEEGSAKQNKNGTK
jgi:hypothetical protein